MSHGTTPTATSKSSLGVNMDTRSAAACLTIDIRLSGSSWPTSAPSRFFRIEWLMSMASTTSTVVSEVSTPLSIETVPGPK